MQFYCILLLCIRLFSYHLFHRTVVWEHSLSKAGVHFTKVLPNSIKNLPAPNALKTRLIRFFSIKGFYSANDFW